MIGIHAVCVYDCCAYYERESSTFLMIRICSATSVNKLQVCSYLSRDGVLPSEMRPCSS